MVNAKQNNVHHIFFTSLWMIFLLIVSFFSGARASPDSVILRPSTIIENADSASEVGIFYTYDTLSTQGYEISLVPGVGDRDNHRFEIKKPDTLITKESFDYETLNTLHIRIQTKSLSDSNKTLDSTFMVTILDSNDPPTALQLSNLKITELRPTGSFIGIFTTADQDTFDNHTYELVSGQGQNDTITVRISHDSLFTDTVFDYETDSTIQINVKSTDSKDAFYISTIHIAITDSQVVPIISVTVPPEITLMQGDTLSLTATATATGEPTPHFTWYFKHSDSLAAIKHSEAGLLNIANASKADKGYYFCVASNEAGSDTSSTFFIRVLKPITITHTLPPTQIAIHGSSTRFTINADGDDTLFYQWYENGLPIQGATHSTYAIPLVNASIHHKKSFYCTVWNRYAIFVSDSITSTLCTLGVNNYYNPFLMKVVRNNDHPAASVVLKIWSDSYVKDFPYDTVSSSIWADSLWILYRTHRYALSAEDAKVKRLAIKTLTDLTPTDTLSTVLAIDPLPVSNDSHYWFSHTINWHRESNSDILMTPFTNTTKIFMVDTLPPDNRISITGKYFDLTDSARIIIDSIQNVDQRKDTTLTIQISKTSHFQNMVFDTTISVSKLLLLGNSTFLSLKKIAPLPIEKHRLYYRWHIRGKNSQLSAMRTSEFFVGWDRPIYGGSLFADSTNRPSQIRLRWTKPTIAADSMRIWWDTNIIDTSWNISLPISQALYVSPLNTVDSATQLSANTLYHFALQFYNNHFWSTVTNESRSMAKTAIIDTNPIANTIVVDTAWFNSTSNRMVIAWHIDRTVSPGILNYKCGYSFSLDSSFSVTKPAQFDLVSQDTTVYELPLGDPPLFDTLYHAGLWLQLVNSVGQDTGLPIPPTDSSTYSVRIPPFTWQKIKLFPPGIDTVYAANGRLTFIRYNEMNGVTIEDTVKAFHRKTPLPNGLFSVGSMAFSFSGKANPIPPFIMGMSHDSSFYTTGLYQDIEGNIHTQYHVKREERILWDTVASILDPHPYMVLVDTSRPIITITEMADPVLKSDSPIPTSFSIADNITNTKWKFMYGNGNNGYPYSDSGIGDTAVGVFIHDHNQSVVHDVFGLRAQIVVDDGVNACTTNVSRRVRTAVSEHVYIGLREWTPLNASAVLDTNDLDILFNQSMPKGNIWKYNNNKIRIFRWHTVNEDSANTWVEYHDSIKNVFNLFPGRLIWIKSADEHRLVLGSGVTQALDKPFMLPLKPQSWTDISLPYQFSIMLRDILDATGPMNDSLEYYHWIKNGSTYEALPMYIPLLDELDTLTYMVDAEQKNDGYTIFNHAHSPITLVIPPTPIALSRYYPAQKKGIRKNNDLFWDVRLQWKNHLDHDSTFKDLRCGFYKHLSTQSFFGPRPPSMAGIRVGIFDSSQNRMGGYALQKNLIQGGMVFDVVFSNTMNETKDIDYRILAGQALPLNLETRVLNTRTLTYESTTQNNTNSKQTLRLKPESQEHRLLVIGTEEYCSNLLQWLLPIPLALLNTYPNPFYKKIAIHYQVPHNIQEVTLDLFTLQGKRLWSHSERKKTSKGKHLVVFALADRMRKSALPLSTGMYILRLRATNKKGLLLYGGEKKLLCVK